MNFLRILFTIFFALLIGALQIGIVSALPFPYSDFPLIAILVAITLLLRVKPTVFWFLFIIVFVLDLYRSAGFGVGILSFAALILVGHKISSSLFSHRSFIGAVVISGIIGGAWATFLLMFGRIFSFGSTNLNGLSISQGLYSVAISSAVTVITVGILYFLIPRWWRSQSLVAIGGRI